MPDRPYRPHALVHASAPSQPLTLPASEPGRPPSPLVGPRSTILARFAAQVGLRRPHRHGFRAVPLDSLDSLTP